MKVAGRVCAALSPILKKLTSMSTKAASNANTRSHLNGLANFLGSARMPNHVQSQPLCKAFQRVE